MVSSFKISIPNLDYQKPKVVGSRFNAYLKDISHTQLVMAKDALRN